MIRNDTQLHQAQADIQKLWRFLESARQTHGGVDYERLAAPYLLQIQERRGLDYQRSQNPQAYNIRSVNSGQLSYEHRSSPFDPLSFCLHPLERGGSHLNGATTDHEHDHGSFP